MDQNSLTPKDLIPYIGSRSRVSEILSGKRKLTLAMMRALHKHLGIPAEILLAEPDSEFPDQPRDIDWAAFPLKEMAKRGWIEQGRDLVSHAEEVMRGLLSMAGGMEKVPAQVLLRQGAQGRLNAKTDQYALCAWCLRVLQLAKQQGLPAEYNPGTITPDFLNRVARLSYYSQGPSMAKEFLANHGIHLIVLSHLPKTYLDGGVMLLECRTPVIGLTLRYDRVDNFWFALLHELSHIARHLDNEKLFIDDHTLRRQEGEDGVEKEADEWAEEALIPQSQWEQSPARQSANESTVRAEANRLEVNPAIVAGRIRFEQNNYRLLTRLVGHGEIRKHFMMQ